jgi:hypothetical protein
MPRKLSKIQSINELCFGPGLRKDGEEARAEKQDGQE